MPQTGMESYPRVVARVHQPMPDSMGYYPTPPPGIQALGHTDEVADDHFLEDPQRPGDYLHPQEVGHRLDIDLAVQPQISP